MIRPSWPRRFFKDSKGVSTAAGTVLLTITILTIFSNVLYWTIYQNTLYSESARESHQTDADRFNEKIIASDGNYSVWGDKVKVEAKLTNVGAVATQIINLWVFDTTQQKYGFNNTIKSLNLNLNPGYVLDLTGENAIMVTIDEARSLDNFNSWFVTARGNTVPLEKEQAQDIPQYVETHQWIDMGTLRFHFDRLSLNFTSENHHDLAPGWVVPGDEYVMFHVKILNTGKVPITLQKHCCFYLMEYMELQGSSQKAWSFYIVSPDSLYPENEMYPYDEESNPYVIQPNPEGKWWLGGPPVTVKFGSYKIGDKEGAKLTSDPDVPYLAFIGLFYEYEEDGEEHQYGQTIPFVAIRSVRPYP